MPKIFPDTVLQNVNEISDICHKSDDPVFITRNGHGDMVVMSMETYEKLADLYKKMALAEIQLSSGEDINAEIVFDILREKHKY